MSCMDSSWCNPCPCCDASSDRIVYPLTDPYGYRLERYLCLECFAAIRVEDPASYSVPYWLVDLHLKRIGKGSRSLLVLSDVKCPSCGRVMELPIHRRFRSSTRRYRCLDDSCNMDVYVQGCFGTWLRTDMAEGGVPG